MAPEPPHLNRRITPGSRPGFIENGDYPKKPSPLRDAQVLNLAEMPVTRDRYQSMASRGRGNPQVLSGSGRPFSRRRCFRRPYSRAT